MTSRPIGTLSQKIHCHASPWVTAPPTSGPPSVASPVTLLNTPRARARRSGGYAALSSASACGMIIAEPAPWTARAPISQPMPGASAHAADAVVNTPSPVASRRRRPYRSPSAAALISSTAKVRVYAPIVHSSSSSEAWRSRRIVLRAVVTTIVSSITINDATDARPRTQRCAGLEDSRMPVHTGSRAGNHRGTGGSAATAAATASSDSSWSTISPAR